MATEYYIVQSDHVQTLDDQVNERLKQGWELQGGVSVCVVKAPLDLDSRGDSPDFWYTYLQAMVKRGD